MRDFDRIKALAGEVASTFETSTRPDGKTFVKLKDGHPQWMQDLCFDAHGDGAMLPNDWRYEYIREACDRLAEASDEDEARDSMAEPDTYTSHLLAWLASGGGRLNYCDEALATYGKVESTEALIAIGQTLEREEVFGQVLAFLEAYADDLEDLEDEPQTLGDA